MLEALAARRTGRSGIARLTLLAHADEVDAQHERARVLLEQGQWHAPNVFYRDQPVRGDTAFVFAGAGASYADMGQKLLADLPQLKQRLASTAPNLLAGLGAAWQPGFGESDPSEQLLAASALAQMHVGLSEDLLGLRADAWLGYSSGETNALFASGVWRDPDALMADMDTSGLMRSHLAGEFRTLKTLWPEHESFVTWTVLAPIDDVRKTVAEYPHVRLLIIDSAEQCLIAGDRAQCDAVVQRMGRARCLPLSYSLAVTCPKSGRSPKPGTSFITEPPIRCAAVASTPVRRRRPMRHHRNGAHAPSLIKRPTPSTCDGSSNRPGRTAYGSSSSTAPAAALRAPSAVSSAIARH
ncbi:MAG: hypothetical protein IPK97_15950 [Ahniella sp.]|nr:hypothetical protein [Ahniella sp.]